MSIIPNNNPELYCIYIGLSKPELLNTIDFVKQLGHTNVVPLSNSAVIFELPIVGFRINGSSCVPITAGNMSDYDVCTVYDTIIHDKSTGAGHHFSQGRTYALIENAVDAVIESLFCRLIERDSFFKDATDGFQFPVRYAPSTDSDMDDGSLIDLGDGLVFCPPIGKTRDDYTLEELDALREVARRQRDGENIAELKEEVPDETPLDVSFDPAKD